MLRKVAIALQGRTQASDLLSHAVGFSKLLRQRDCDFVVFILLVQVELDWAWVCVKVLNSAFLSLTFVLLVCFGF